MRRKKIKRKPEMIEIEVTLTENLHALKTSVNICSTDEIFFFFTSFIENYAQEIEILQYQHDPLAGFDLEFSTI